MQDRPTHKPATGARAPVGVNPLKFISREQFAALGVESVVFMRKIDGASLAEMLPQANLDVSEGPFILVLSADGRPVLVTDTRDSLDAWLEEQPVALASVH
ncbi:MAG: DUF1150 domain-containing protein [Alphaproteobacteria bacterium]|nr:DUF1150 domain-containing protein [Alphaproteobacteria bacterium]